MLCKQRVVHVLTVFLYVTNMSDQLELYCLVLGDGPSHIFPVKIAGTESVGTLKEVIKAKKPHRFQHLDADSLVLLQVSISANSDEELQEKLRLRNKDLDVSLSSWKRLAEFFSGIGGEALHIVIQAPTGERSQIWVMSLNDLCSATPPPAWD